MRSARLLAAATTVAILFGAAAALAREASVAPPAAVGENGPARFSLPTESDRAVWRKPGFRLVLGAGYGRFIGLAGAPVGNTLSTKPTAAVRPGSGVKPLVAPAPTYEVTKMPLPRGRCSGRYTEEARQAGIEGTVVLDLVIDEEGNTRDVNVVKGLGYGLTEAALAALRSCRFTPGERGGRAVPVRLRGFKIRFFLQGGD